MAWGMDVIGPIEQKASNGQRFIFVAIDYFTKWVEAVTFKLVTKKVMVDFIHFNLIFRFVRTSVGATPYSLVYGTEAVIPAEIEIPSLRMVVEAEIHDDEWIKTRLEQLSLIDEKRLTSVCHGQLYQKRMPRAYNNKVRPGHFEEGQLVLRRICPHHAETKSKFSPNWRGSFVVKRVLPNGALYLEDIEGKVTKTVINTDAVKRYHI
nr:uncharacterized protein LOC101244705 [Solanum lycopersicum]